MAAGALDSTFGGGEQTVAFNRGGSNSDQGQAVVVQSNGKILVAGTVQRTSSGDQDFGVTRLNTNGTRDTTFGSNGNVVISFDLGGNLADRVAGIALQSDGKIVVVGSAQASSSTSRFAIARLNSNGTLDTTFSSDGKQTVSFGSNVIASGVAIQSNGKIVVAGTTTIGSGGDTDMAVARLNTNGSLDTTFSGDGLTTVSFDLGGDNTDRGNAVALQSDGKIVLVGSAQRNSSGDHDMAIARLTTSGILDSTFDNDGKRTIAFDLGGSNFDRANAVAIASGKIVVAGTATLNSSGDTDFAVARLTSNGSLDTTFSSDGKQTVAFDRGGNNRDVANAVKVQSDGKIILAGSARTGTTNDDYAVARLSSSGSPDNTFDGDGRRTSGLSGDDAATALAIQSNGRIVIAGFSNTSGDYDFGIIRLLNS